MLITASEMAGVEGVALVSFNTKLSQEPAPAGSSVRGGGGGGGRTTKTWSNMIPPGDCPF